VIRYVLIIVFAATVLGLTGTALDQASAIRGEQAIEREIGTVDRAATALFELEATTPDSTAPRRIVELELPEPTLTRDGMQTLRFERVPDADRTRVSYSVAGRRVRTTTIAAPLQRSGGDTLDFSDRTGMHRLKLVLETDEHGKPVVTVSAY
jgi:hypothetical protein